MPHRLCATTETFCNLIEIDESHLILATLFTKPDKKLKEVNPDEYEKEGFPYIFRCISYKLEPIACF